MTASLGLLINLDPLFLVFYRTGISALLFLILFKSASLEVNNSKLNGKIIGTGFILAAHWITFFLSARVSNASICLAGMATTSIWTSLFDPIIRKRRFSFYEVFFGLLGAGGLWIIFEFEASLSMGLALALVSALLAALFTIFNAQFIKSENPYRISFLEIASASVSSLLFILIFQGVTGENLAPVLPGSISDIIYLLILAGICTVYAFSQSVEIMKRVSPFSFNLAVNLEPVYGIILALLLFQEKEFMSAQFYLGGTLILGSVLLFQILARRLKDRIS